MAIATPNFVITTKCGVVHRKSPCILLIKQVIRCLLTLPGRSWKLSTNKPAKSQKLRHSLVFWVPAKILMLKLLPARKNMTGLKQIKMRSTILVAFQRQLYLTVSNQLFIKTTNTNRTSIRNTLILLATIRQQFCLPDLIIPKIKPYRTA